MLLHDGPLFLTGFMGAGKSTIGRLLAERLNSDYIDLDDMIATKAGISIPDIFELHGEEYFRRLESEALTSLPDHGPVVCSTGGGLVVARENREYMHATGFIVYLQAEWQTLKRRLADSVGRPLLAGDRDWSRTRDLFESRIPCYEDADLIVATDRKTPEQIVSCICHRIGGVER